MIIKNTVTPTKQPLSHGYQINAEVHRHTYLLKASLEFASQNQQPKLSH